MLPSRSTSTSKSTTTCLKLIVHPSQSGSDSDSNSGADSDSDAESDSVVPGGFLNIFSRQSLSRVVGAGNDATVGLALAAAAVLRSLADTISSAAALAERLEGAAGLLERLNDEREKTIDPKRLPLKSAVERAIVDAREELAQMDGRLRGGGFSRSFVESLYPELARRTSAVADEDDEDDEDSDPVEPG